MITLVLGGARSGKSEVAERLAAACTPPVTYVATAVVGDDADLAARVAAHQDRRPSTWGTVDAGPDLAGTVAALGGTVIIDSLGVWLAGQAAFVPDGRSLVDMLRGRTGDTVVVSDEVGLGVHPETALGTRFRDALGQLNRLVAEAADQVLLVVAGRVLPLDRLDDLADR